MKVCVLGTGNVGIAIATDLSYKGFDVSLVKTTERHSESFERLIKNDRFSYLKERNQYSKAQIRKVSTDLSEVKDSDIVFVTIQSTYHEELIKKISEYTNKSQIFVCICSYLSSAYFEKYCHELPIVAETTGPYLEGRIELQDIPNEVVFRVGCRLSRSPMSVLQSYREKECMDRLHLLYKGFSNDYTPTESALLNPNLVLHTVGSVMSFPRIEYSKGDFCMYREAYSRANKTTMRTMLKLDEEKKSVLRKLNCKPVDIFDAGGFLGDRLESFYAYSESSDRAKSPTSVMSRYITEDVSQGLVLLESIAKKIGIKTPVTTALIEIANSALGVDFRKEGRTAERLGIEIDIESLCS